jgi:hypothetical protein
VIIFVWALVSVFTLILLCAFVLDRKDRFEGVQQWQGMKADTRGLTYDKTKGLWVAAKSADEETAGVAPTSESQP